MTIRKARRQERAKAPDSKLHAPPKMTMYIFASPVTLTGAEEKKTGPSRFRPDFLTELSKLSKFRIYKSSGFRGGMCQVPSFRLRGCRGVGMATRTARTPVENVPPWSFLCASGADYRVPLAK